MPKSISSTGKAVLDKLSLHSSAPAEAVYPVYGGLAVPLLL